MLKLHEQAPQQLPMGSMCLQDMPTEFATSTSPPFENAEASESTLRRRRPQMSQGGHKALTQAAFEHDQDANSDSQSEAEAVLSRDMADGLLEQLQHCSGDGHDLAQRFQHWAFSSKVSSRAAQLAIQDASAHHAMLLASSLRGQVRRAAQSKHANYVVQKIVEVMPITTVGFVVEELLGFGYETARHRFGCRLLCRILEHLSPGNDATFRLIEDILQNVEELCSHAFGSYVVRHILEFGLPEHKHRVAVALIPHAGWYAKHKLGSHVVEAALRTCPLEDRGAISTALLADQDIAALATNQFGRHVVRALLSMPGPLKDDTEEALVRVKDQLRHSRFGRGVLQKVHAGGA